MLIYHTPHFLDKTCVTIFFINLYVLYVVQVLLSLVFISDYMTLKGFNVFQFQILSEKFQDLASGTCLLQLSYLTRANLGSILQTGLFKLLLPRVV